MRIIKASSAQHSCTNAHGDKGLREELSDNSKWYYFCLLILFLSLFKIAFHQVCLILSFPQYIIYLQAARETGALKAAKDQLEKRVEDLTLRVALEKRSRVIIFSLVFLICIMS